MFTWLQKLKERWREGKRGYVTRVLDAGERHALDALEKGHDRFFIGLPLGGRNPEATKQLLCLRFKPMAEANGYDLFVTREEKSWRMTFSRPEKTLRDMNDMTDDYVNYIKINIRLNKVRFGLELSLALLETYPSLQDELMKQIIPLLAESDYSLSEKTSKKTWRLELTK